MKFDTSSKALNDDQEIPGITIVYQHDAFNMYVGPTEMYGDLMPEGAVLAKPEIIEGYKPKWNKVKGIWEQVEDHIGTVVFVNNVRTEIDAYGPLPSNYTLEYVCSIDELKTKKIGDVNTKFHEVTGSYTKNIPQAELDTWKIQRDEALAWESVYLVTADPDAVPTPNIDILASIRGKDRVELLLKILDKSKKYDQAIIKATAVRQAYIDKIEACSTEEELNEIYLDEFNKL